MALFKPSHRRSYIKDEKAYALFELAYTSVDMAAALLFIVGSVMFFSKDWQTSGTWCFLIGSIFFALKPSIRIYREIYYLSKGDYEDLVGKESNS